MKPIVLTGIGVLLVACQATTPSSDQIHAAGWYMEHAGRGYFLPCGGASQFRVIGDVDIHAAAPKNVVIEDDMPVYARFSGTILNDELEVTQVQQLGSSIPMKDCPLNGVAIPEKTD